MTVPSKELGTGILSYGKFIFPNAIKARITANAFDDSTSRYTKYVVHRLEVETVLYPGVDEDLQGSPGAAFFPEADDSADAGMSAIKRILETRGLPLLFEEKGYGDFNINTANGQQDVLAGPNPKILAWEPLGNNYAVRIVWSVEVTLTACALFTIQDNRITEFNFSTVWSIDQLGLTTRTISGHWEVVLRIQDNVVINNADLLRDRFTFSIPLAFKRLSQNYSLNHRQDRMDFSIVDQEYAADDKNPYHNGVVENTLKQTTRSLDKGVMSEQWMTTISGTVTVAKNKPRLLAWIAFIDVVKSRLDHALQNAMTSSGESSPGDEGEGEGESSAVIIPGHLSVTEEIYGRSMTFSFSWVMFTTLKTFINASGFWQPVDRVATIQGQRTGLTAPNEAWTPRGAKQLRQTRSQPLIGLCQNQAAVGLNAFANRKKTVDDSAEIFSCKKPTADKSWVMWSPNIYKIEHTNRYASFPASGGSRTETPFRLGATTANRATVTGGSASTQSKAYQLPTIHQSSPQSAEIVFFGSANRLGFAIPEITLETVGGAKVTPKGDHRQLDRAPINVGGCPLYRSMWIRTYEFVDDIGQGNQITTKPSVNQINVVPLGVHIGGRR